MRHHYVNDQRPLFLVSNLFPTLLNVFNGSLLTLLSSLRILCSHLLLASLVWFKVDVAQLKLLVESLSTLGPTEQQRQRILFEDLLGQHLTVLIVQLNIIYANFLANSCTSSHRSDHGRRAHLD